MLHAVPNLHTCANAVPVCLPTNILTTLLPRTWSPDELLSPSPLPLSAICSISVDTCAQTQITSLSAEDIYAALDSWKSGPFCHLGNMCATHLFSKTEAVFPDPSSLATVLALELALGPSLASQSLDLRFRKAGFPLLSRYNSEFEVHSL